MDATDKDNEYREQYTEEAFWDKVKRYAQSAGRSVLQPALTMHYAASDAETPKWAKTVIYSALGYFILPTDALPDFTPMVGYADDLGTLTMALATVGASVKTTHVERARASLARWFGGEDDEQAAADD